MLTTNKSQSVFDSIVKCPTPKATLCNHLPYIVGTYNLSHAHHMPCGAWEGLQLTDLSWLEQVTCGRGMPGMPRIPGMQFLFHKINGGFGLNLPGC